MSRMVVLVAALGAVAALTSTASASSRAQYGVQDDAWLEVGTTKMWSLDERLAMLDRLGEALSVGAQVGDLERAESGRRGLPELAEALRAAAAESRRRRTTCGRSAQHRRRRGDLAASDPHGALRSRVHAGHAPRRREVRRLLASPVPALVRPRPPRDAATNTPLHALADNGKPAVPAQERVAELRSEACLADRIRVQDESARPDPRRLTGSSGALSR